jgi:serine/threonine protein kinase
MAVLTAGTRLGPYEIVSAIGEGGMGEVYQATDTRLDRTVAIKVLRADLSPDPQFQQRFEREARAVSALSHPNICTLYDIGSEKGAQFIVMEFLEGETLSNRLQNGPLPPKQLLQYAIQIADALDKAHRSGIIHRDLKPSNIKITKTGVKLLDFGVAKMVLESGTEALTKAHTLTQEGRIFGTLQYISPEQLRGIPADTRSDIFSLGAVLYEMATGRHPFQAPTPGVLIANILKDEPAEITEPLPPGLARLILDCLAKDPEQRRQSAHDIAAELRWIAETQTSTLVLEKPRAARGRNKLRPYMIATAIVLAILAFAIGYLFRNQPKAALNRFTLLLPAGFRLDPMNTSLALSPDGRILAFAGTDAQGKNGLWLRKLDEPEAQWISGSQNATYPFWSPDSRYLAFFADGKLRKVPASGAPVQSLCPAPDSRGGTWSQKDLIVFTPTSSGGLFSIPASGGTPTPLTDTHGKYVSHRVPHFLPDSRHVLFYWGELGVQESPNNGVYCLDIISKKMTRILPLKTEAIYMDGALVFVREGTLMSQPFDLKKLQLNGEAKPIAEDVYVYQERYTGAYTFTNNLLIYQTDPQAAIAQLTWFDLDGHKLGIAGGPSQFASILLDSAGTQGLTTVTKGLARDLWIRDLANGTDSRLTFHKDAYWEGGIAWSPDGTKILYGDLEGKLFLIPADSSSPPQPVAPQSRRWWPRDWASDSSKIIMETHEKETGEDLAILNFKDQTITPFLASKADEKFGAFSPDGNWIGYLSDESGSLELYVVHDPQTGGKWQISNGGVLQWRWTSDGRIIYLAPDRRLIAADVKPVGNSLQVSAPKFLFGGAALPDGLVQIASDGSRLLIALPVSEGRRDTLNVIQNY